MSQDLRELFKKGQDKKEYKMRKGHKNRFLERLNMDLPKTKKSSFYVLKIAAAIVVIFSSGVYAYVQLNKGSIKDTKTPITRTIKNTEQIQQISLGDLSPNLQKVEQYYIGNINLNLAQLEVSETNKILIDSFMERLSTLDSDYKELNDELNEIGPNDQTISALIKNLQLRLRLLQKLKIKLNELKETQNEQITTNTI